MPSRPGSLLCAMLLLAGAGAARAQEAVVVRAIEVRGASVYGPDEVLHLLRIEEGRPLIRTPTELGELLETRYRDDGFPGARVSVSYDATRGRLALEVDEGRLAELTVAGLRGTAHERAIRELGLTRGEILNEVDIEDGLERLERASDGAVRFGTMRGLEGGDYVVERGSEGARLVVRPELPWLALRPGIAAPGVAGRNNRVDGLNAGLGLDVTLHDRRSYHHTTLYLRDAWGLGGEHFRFAAGVVRQIGERVPIVLGYQRHDLTDSDDSFRERGLEEAPGETYRTGSLSDHFRRRGHTAYLFVLPAPRLELGVSWRGDRYQSLETTTRWTLFDETPALPNPAIDEGEMRSLVLSLRATSAPALYEERPAGRRDALLHESLYGDDRRPPSGVRLAASFETAAPSSLGGDFDFRRLIASVRSRHEPVRRLRFDARVLAGWSDGAPPAQKRFAIGGGGTLRGYARKAFAGERFALLTGELSFALRSSLPRLIAFYDGGAAWRDGAGGSGWKSALGLGLRWPARARTFLRVDFALPLDRPAERRVHTMLRIQLPL